VNPFLLSMMFGFAAALASLAGAYLILRSGWRGQRLFYFIAVGAGFMLAAAVTEMLPASLELVGNGAFIWVLVGYLVVHFFEHGLTGHFHMGEETHVEERFSARASIAAVLGMSMHTLFDGAAIAAGVLHSARLGSRSVALGPPREHRVRSSDAPQDSGRGDGGIGNAGCRAEQKNRVFGVYPGPAPRRARDSRSSGRGESRLARGSGSAGYPNHPPRPPSDEASPLRRSPPPAAGRVRSV